MAWVSEADLKPGTTYRRSVRRNTEEWLMGCRGEGEEGKDTDSGQVGVCLGVRQDTVKQHQWRSGDTNYWLWSWQKQTCSLATVLSAQSKSATSTGHKESFNTLQFMLTV